VSELPIAERLTPRELEVVRAMVQGLTNRQLGGQLGIERQTVTNHLTSIFRKLGAHSRVDVARMLLEEQCGLAAGAVQALAKWARLDYPAWKDEIRPGLTPALLDAVEAEVNRQGGGA
jgi:DNA-binding CsgD family transcriptional regulator